MMRPLLIAAAFAQMNVMFLCLFAYPYLYIPAALGLVALVAAIPPKAHR